MRLEDMFSNFLECSYEEQRSFIASYREARAKDMRIETRGPTKKVKETSKNNILTDDQKALLKKLGISVKDYSELNITNNVDSDDDDDPESFFADDSFDLEEE